MTILSSSSLSGNSVKNPKGEDLGKIEDFMINTDNGSVQYAVISFGGFLGMGDKLFAVPLTAMQVDTKDHCFVLDTDKTKLENAPGFDKDHWPNMADPKFSTSIHDYYGVQPHGH